MPVPATTSAPPATDQRLANAIRALAMDAVEAAKSGHPGMPMGMAEIALALWRALPGFRGEASLVTFVARIAHNRGVDHMLARQRDPGGAALAEEYPDPLPEPVQRVEAGERRARLVAAIHELPLGMRQVVTLALEGFSNVEIAGVLDLEANAVDARLSRARRRLRELLGEPS